jgi:acyl carrier protein
LFTETPFSQTDEPMTAQAQLDPPSLEKLHEAVRRCLPRRVKDVALTPELHLENDLYFDSMGLTVLLFRIEQDLGLNLAGEAAALQSLRTLGDVTRLVRRLTQPSDQPQPAQVSGTDA